MVLIAAFVRDLPTLLYNEIQSLLARGMRALALDLRGCPGGDLDAALRLCDDFVERGTVIAQRIDGDGDVTDIAARQGKPYPFPLFVLVDRNTASAAELFAGSLQSLGRAVVVGERTFGKGSSQKLVPGFDAPGATYVTVAAFALPNGAPIEGLGVRPAVECEGDSALSAVLARFREM